MSSPDWAAIGQPVAALLDTIELQHPKPRPAPRATARAPGLAEIEAVIRDLRRASLALVRT